MSRIIRDREELADFVREQRSTGVAIVFTNGVFDLFHAGHLDSIRRAKAEGDFLIIGVNSDASVQRLKGAGRPILPLDQRLRILAALEGVGAVVPFDEDTPAELIAIIQPDVLVKGGHYTVEQIVGHELVLARGGRVLSLPLVDGRSTTNIVDVIKERFIESPR
jgi:D-beta-D-heptose 7-phosphate kinase/D-beta-D-heptose 1-phosphate adenosyltransferase